MQAPRTLIFSPSTHGRLIALLMLGLLLLWGLPALAQGGGAPTAPNVPRPAGPSVPRPTTGGGTTTAGGPGSTAGGLVPSIPLPSVTIGAKTPQTPQDVSTGIQLLILLTLLSLAPSLIIMATGFTRIVIVLGLVRNALGTQNLPPNQVITGLALILTFFVMSPVFNKINTDALQPYFAGQITYVDGLARAQARLREFMFNNTRGHDLKMMVDLARMQPPKTRQDVPSYVLLPSFILSELKTAFQMGFVVYIPFLIIDLVVSSTLMSMGMIFLPPVLISLPFKLLLFVMTDGWGVDRPEFGDEFQVLGAEEEHPGSNWKAPRLEDSEEEHPGSKTRHPSNPKKDLRGNVQN